MKLRFLVFLLSIMALFSCNDPFKKQNFYLSNPTNQEIKITLDDKLYTLSPQAIEKVKLDAGIHELTYKGKKNTFNVFNQNSGGIINPTLEPHYIYSMVYATEGNFDKFGSIDRDVLIDGVLYKDNIMSTNALFIDNNSYGCTYFLGEDYPKEQITSNKNSVGNFFNKFFTKKEFIDFYESNLPAEYKGYHQKNHVKNGECTITEPNTLELKLPDIAKEEVIAFYKKQIELLEEFKTSTDARRQKEIQKELFDLSMERSKLKINYSQLTPAQSQTMNDFVHTKSRISGAGIIQLN